MIDNPDLMVVGVLMFVGTLWLFNIAMENGPFIDDFPIKTSIYKGFSISAPRSTTFDCTITRFLSHSQGPKVTELAFSISQEATSYIPSMLHKYTLLLILH